MIEAFTQLILLTVGTMLNESSRRSNLSRHAGTRLMSFVARKQNRVMTH